MVEKYALGAIFVCAFAVFLVPMPAEDTGSPAAAAPASKPKAESAFFRNASSSPRVERTSAGPGWAAGETVLEREYDGHFYADVRVDGGSYRFLVDTGASILALTGEDAEAMGLFWDESDLSHIGEGASGAVRGVPVVLDRVELGGHVAENVEAAIIPDGLGVSLLGQSFLQKVGKVQIEGERMVLSD